MTEEKQSWGALVTLVEEVSKGGLDGFEAPFEVMGMVGTEWQDGTPVVKYTTEHGILLFKEKAHEHFGYVLAKDFESAVKRGVVRAKTPEGAISLGRARGMDGKPIHVSLSAVGLFTQLRFHAESSEEVEKIRQILRRLFPEAKIYAAENPVKLALMGAFSFNIFKSFGKFGELTARQKKALALLSFSGLVAVVLGILTPLRMIHGWYDVAASLVFLILLVLLYPDLKPQNHAKTLEKESDIK